MIVWEIAVVALVLGALSRTAPVPLLRGRHGDLLAIAVVALLVRVVWLETAPARSQAEELRFVMFGQDCLEGRMTGLALNVFVKGLVMGAASGGLAGFRLASGSSVPRPSS